MADKITDRKTERKPDAQPAESFFARIPYEVFEAAERGQLTATMFFSLVWLYKWADWSSGIVRNFTASRLVWASNAERGARTYERAIRNLVKGGWIVSHHRPGSKIHYSLMLSNYLALIGSRKGQILNQREIKDWRDPSQCYVADDVADHVADFEHEVEPEDDIAMTTTIRVKENPPDFLDPLSTIPANDFARHRDEQLQELLHNSRLCLESDLKEKGHVNFRSSREVFMKSCAAFGIKWAVGGQLWKQLLAEVTHPEKHAPIRPAPDEQHHGQVTLSDAHQLRRHASQHGWNKTDVDSYLVRTFNVKRILLLSWPQYIAFRKRVETPPDKN